MTPHMRLPTEQPVAESDLPGGQPTAVPQWQGVPAPSCGLRPRHPPQGPHFPLPLPPPQAKLGLEVYLWGQSGLLAPRCRKSRSMHL